MLMTLSCDYAFRLTVCCLRAQFWLAELNKLVINFKQRHLSPWALLRKWFAQHSQ